MTIMEIRIDRATEDALFGAEVAIDNEIDTRTSTDEYNRVLVAQVTHYYAAGAPVILVDGNGISTRYRVYTDNDDANAYQIAETEAAIQRLAEDLYDDGNRWMVTRELTSR